MLLGCQTVGSAIDGVFQPELRNEMTDADVALAIETMQGALETSANGEGGNWLNPESGNSGAIAPVRTYQTDAGLFCRDFREELTVGGRTAAYDATACREDDGVWYLAEG